MTIDVTAERVVPLPPGRVAGYAMDWRHDADWTQGIRTAELTAQAEGGGFGAGAEVTRTAYFLGRRIDYVLRVAAYEPPRLLDMVSVAGPLPMHITHTFDPHPDGTLARIRVRGGKGGFHRLAAPLPARQVRCSLVKDLRDLEARLLEQEPAEQG
ncbi:SRPBCC family protein [Streptomyces sp. S.PB5]|uniref:SRPBCC family protein n=1 Tax=Streptomyces sp. S.PB5 TaxID=3020844 RepID=UPI0025B262FE|nr:SRPBCC family protein [Streptomyces sp. S.PB5]MDN3023534.1 SRPBCC family protein [Streptomyces sp. S.PB5]